MKPQSITQIVSSVMGVPIFAIKDVQNYKWPVVVMARWIIWEYMFERGVSYTKIGRRFKTGHWTVRAGVIKLPLRVAGSETLAMQYDEVRKRMSNQSKSKTIQ